MPDPTVSVNIRGQWLGLIDMSRRNRTSNRLERLLLDAGAPAPRDAYDAQADRRPWRNY